MILPVMLMLVYNCYIFLITFFVFSQLLLFSVVLSLLNSVTILSFLFYYFNKYQYADALSAIRPLVSL